MNTTPPPEPVRSEATDSVRRHALLAEIRVLSPSATDDFLARFSTDRLALFAAHLRAAQEPRGRNARWVRPAETPAVIFAEPRD